LRNLNFKSKFCRLIEDMAKEFRAIGEVKVVGLTERGEAVEIGEPGWEDKIDRARLGVYCSKGLKQKVKQLAEKLGRSDWVIYDHKNPVRDSIAMAYKPFSNEEFDEWIHKIEEKLNLRSGKRPSRFSFVVMDAFNQEPDKEWKEKFVDIIESLPFWLMYLEWRNVGSYQYVFVGSDESYYSFDKKMRQWFDGTKFAEEIGRK